MNLETMIYLVELTGRVRDLANGVLAVCVISMVGTAVWTIAASADPFSKKEERDKALPKGLCVAKRVGVAMAVAITVSLFTPSSKSLAAMLVVPAVVENEQVQNIAGNGLEALETLTEKWLEDLRGRGGEK